MQYDEPTKKPPLSKETASSKLIIENPKYTAKETRLIKSIAKRMTNDFFAILPSWILTKEYFDKLGPAIWLLAVIMRSCDWKTGVWYGKVQALALWLGVDVRTIDNYLLRLEDGVGITREQRAHSIEIYLPDPLIPSLILPEKEDIDSQSGKKTISADRKIISPQEENIYQEKGKNVPGWNKIGDTLQGRFEVKEP